MRSSLEDLLEYLVVKVLAGKESVVKALIDYFVYAESPSNIAVKYDLSKNQVRGYAQRIIEKTGSAAKAKVILKYATPIILKIKPIVRKTNGALVKCLLCGEELPIQVIEDHIRKKHASVIDDYLYSIIDLLKKNIVADNLIT